MLRGRQALALFGLWTAVGLVFALPRLAVGADWHGPLLNSLAEWWSWCLMTPIVVLLNDRVPVDPKPWFIKLALQAGIGVGTTILYIYVDIVMTAVLERRPLPNLASAKLLLDALHGSFLWAMIVYALIATAWKAARNQRRALAAELSMERLERSYAEARLNVLRLQLDPHFLFNALNTISSQLETEPRLARRMIEHLGDLLRHSLEPGSRHEVPLSEELDFLDHYLAIQRIRFGDRLEVRLEVSPEVDAAMVPSMIMQPLVENAIRHGISRRAGGGKVSIRAWQAGEWLEIRVDDDGVGLPPGWRLDRDAGLGLSATRERVAGPSARGRFAVRVRDQGGTAIEMSLPLRVPEPCHA